MCSITLFTIEPPPNTCMLHTRWGCQHPPHVHITYMVRGATPTHMHMLHTVGVSPHACTYYIHGGVSPLHMYMLHTRWGVAPLTYVYITYTVGGITPPHMYISHTQRVSPLHTCTHYIAGGYHMYTLHAQGCHPCTHICIYYINGGCHPPHTCTYYTHAWRVSLLHTHMYILHTQGLSPPTHICIYYINGGRHPPHTHMYTLHTQGCHRHTRNLCTHYIDGGGAEWSQRQGEQP